MLELRNRTPFNAAIAPWLSSSARDSAVVVIKGTLQVDRAKGAVIAPDQVPIRFADEFSGDPEVSSVRYGTDACPAKVGTDVILRGHAYPAAAGATSVDVSLRIARLAKVVRVFGDRTYFRSGGAWHITSPVRFDHMPLVWERAFGGADVTSSSPEGQATCWQNPVGTGFAPSQSPNRLEGLSLPNLEDPRALVTGPGVQVSPAGFGWVAAHWLPRRSYAGTYDDRWRREQAPYLPEDFDRRFFTAAAEGLSATPHLRGGELLEVLGASPGEGLRVKLPSLRWKVTAWLEGSRIDPEPVLDTLVVEPDDYRLTLTWKAEVPCSRKFLNLERVTVAVEGLP